MKVKAKAQVKNKDVIASGQTIEDTVQVVYMGF